MAISFTQARQLFTDTVVAVYLERPTVTSFLRSFFRVKNSKSLYVTIEVRRGNEMIATDVYRGEPGNRNRVDLSTQKTILPAYFHEWIVMNEMRIYLVAFQGESTTAFNELVTEMVEWMVLMQNKIERAVERQCSQVMQTGIVTMESGTNLDFKRKATSLVAYNVAFNWALSTVDPIATLKAGAAFIRKNGRSAASTYDVIMGGNAYDALVQNPKVQARSDIRDFKLADIRSPIATSQGGTFHGMISGGSYNFRLWTYPQYYEWLNPQTGLIEQLPYIDDGLVNILPENPEFDLVYAQVPMLPAAVTGRPDISNDGQFVIHDTVDQDSQAHKLHVKSAPVPIPTAIDCLYTQRVLPLA